VADQTSYWSSLQFRQKGATNYKRVKQLERTF
jgi:hypothetical protein